MITRQDEVTNQFQGKFWNPIWQVRTAGDRASYYTAQERSRSHGHSLNVAPEEGEEQRVCGWWSQVRLLQAIKACWCAQGPGKILSCREQSPSLAKGVSSILTGTKRMGGGWFLLWKMCLFHAHTSWSHGNHIRDSSGLLVPHEKQVMLLKAARARSHQHLLKDA